MSNRAPESWQDDAADYSAAPCCGGRSFGCAMCLRDQLEPYHRELAAEQAADAARDERGGE